MLPFSTSGSKVVPRHQVSGYSNGYPRGNTFDISPHRFQRRGATSAVRRRRRLFIRFGIVIVLCILAWYWFISGASFISLASLSLFSGGDDFQLETVRYYDLSNVQGTARGWEREERILLCVPLRDAEAHLPMFFSHIRNFTYPHHLVDIAFLVSDSKDRTLELLVENMESIQADEDDKQHYGEISIIEKDFGQKVNQDVESRHGFAAQASRRKLMAQARNWLLSAALRPYHSWVYWRDVDVETAPFTILEDLMRHNKDVIVPNVWRPLPDWLGGEQPYDLNSWQESETALALADTLDEDAVIVEGYAEYATWRPHLAYLRDPYGDPDMEMEIDGVGGVSILAKAKVFRYGVHFPAFSFEKHAETEGFGKMARRMGFSVVGLPHYTIWHLYEPSVDDIRHMEQMEQEKAAREQEEKEKAEKARKIKEQFSDANSQWEKDKTAMQNIALQEKKQNEQKKKAQQEKLNEQKKAQQQKLNEQKQAQQEAAAGAGAGSDTGAGAADGGRAGGAGGVGGSAGDAGIVAGRPAGDGNLEVGAGADAAGVGAAGVGAAGAGAAGVGAAGVGAVGVGAAGVGEAGGGGAGAGGAGAGAVGAGPVGAGPGAGPGAGAGKPKEKPAGGAMVPPREES